MSGPTPGPWEWAPFCPPSPPDYDTDPEPLSVYGADDEPVAYPDDNVRNTEEAEANARLIAAAPELLAACRLAIRRITLLMPFPLTDDPMIAAAIEKVGDDTDADVAIIHAAVSRAEGAAASSPAPEGRPS